MEIATFCSRRKAVALSVYGTGLGLVSIVLSVCFLSGCGNKDTSAEATSRSPALQQAAAAASPASAPGEPTVISPAANGDIDATLAQLTQELHHTMVGRKLNRNFDEFVALRQLQVPAPPPGKKYAISDKWKVILVDQ